MRMKNESDIILNRMVRKGLTDRKTAEEVSYADIWGKNILGRGNEEHMKMFSCGWCEGCRRNLKDINGAGEV